MADDDLAQRQANTLKNLGDSQKRDYATAGATAAAQDASKLKPKSTGRGMLPGESVSDWKARLQKQDSENDLQKKALTQ